MTSEVGPDQAARILTAHRAHNAIRFHDGFADKDVPEVSWSTYGLIETNEVGVIVQCGRLCFGALAHSSLVHPAMADRLFGIDVADEQLALKLSEELWAAFSSELTEEADRARTSKRDET